MTHKEVVTSQAHLDVGELVPGLLAEGEGLPQRDSKAPHVGLHCEGAVQDAFWRHPPDRQHGRPPYL